MGLGKTAQAIAAMAQLARRGEVRRTLIVCPASLKHQWLREIREFTGLEAPDVRVVGGPREARREVYAEAPPVLVTVLPASAAAALGRLGAASPLASAEVLYRSSPAAPSADPVAEAARTLAALAVRKRLAAAALVAAGQAAEALPLFREAMALACRSLDPQGDPGAEPAQLLAAIHARLLARKLLTEEHASALARADEAARAFAASPVAPPEPLVSRIAAEAAALVGRVAGSR